MATLPGSGPFPSPRGAPGGGGGGRNLPTVTFPREPIQLSDPTGPRRIVKFQAQWPGTVLSPHARSQPGNAVGAFFPRKPRPRDGGGDAVSKPGSKILFRALPGPTFLLRACEGLTAVGGPQPRPTLPPPPPTLNDAVCIVGPPGVRSRAGPLRAMGSAISQQRSPLFLARGPACPAPPRSTAF
jgi:hypothetical protein